jgi:hypothetical protein
MLRYSHLGSGETWACFFCDGPNSETRQPPLPSWKVGRQLCRCIFDDNWVVERRKQVSEHYPQLTARVGTDRCALKTPVVIVITVSIRKEAGRR